MNNIPIVGILIAVVFAFVVLYFLYMIKKILGLRRVVSPSEVHIVQSQKGGRVTYGQFMRPDGTDADRTPTPQVPMRNTYYEWPTWLPVYGVTVSKLPLTVFDQDLKNYEAYDKERVPFVVDVKAFYRIADPQLAAERISNMDALKAQLMASLQGAIRSILAQHEIEDIMQGRSEFALKFTEAVNNDLKAWGVETVKSVELMDIKDAPDHEVIVAIMAKRISGIQMESRTAVAGNNRAAREAEIQAERQVEIQEADAKEQVGLRQATVTQKVGIAAQQAQQEVAKSEKDTTTAQMEVRREAAERQAEIDRKVANINANRDKEVAETNAAREKSVQVTNAERDKTVQVTQASAAAEVLVKTSEGEKSKLLNFAEGNLQTQLKDAEGIAAKGKAEGEAATAIAMAPVTAQLKLQEGIGGNQQYQDFVVRQRVVEKDEKVGIATAEAQGKALANAKIKVLSNVGGGASSLGQQLGSLLEGLNMTDTGNRILTRLGASPAGGDDDDTVGGVTTDAGGQRIPLKDRVQRPGANGSTAK